VFVVSLMGGFDHSVQLGSWPPDDLTITLNQHAGRVREYIGAAVQDRPSVYVWYGVENLTVRVDSRDPEFDEEMRALGYL